MKVKIGNKIYNAEEEPIMLMLSDEDKKNIANMLPECKIYCAYPDEYDKDKLEIWMHGD